MFDLPPVDNPFKVRVAADFRRTQIHTKSAQVHQAGEDYDPWVHAIDYIATIELGEPGVKVTTESFCNVWSRGSDGSEGMVGIVGRDGFGGRGAARGTTKSAEAIVIVSPTVWR